MITEVHPTTSMHGNMWRRGFGLFSLAVMTCSITPARAQGMADATGTLARSTVNPAASSTTKSDNVKAANADIMEMSQQQFHTWLQDRYREASRAHQKPVDVEKAFLQRVNSNRTVSDESFLLVVRAWSEYERPAGDVPTDGRDAKGPSYKDTQRVVELLLPLSVGKPLLEAKLHEQKAEIYRLNRDPANQIKEYDEVQRLLVPLHVDVDRRRVQASLMKADLLAVAGEKSKADAEYRKVLSYPWYQVKDATVMYQMAEYYAMAGNGLIQVNRGNLKALQAITFTEGVMERLRPTLEAAIADAGGPAVTSTITQPATATTPKSTEPKNQ